MQFVNGKNMLIVAVPATVTLIIWNADLQASSLDTYYVQAIVIQERRTISHYTVVSMTLSERITSQPKST